MGSTGEFPHLNIQEKKKLISTFRKNIHNKELIVQVGMPSLKETIELANIAQDLGADKVLIIGNFYYKNRLNKEAIESFYINAAEKIKLPVMIYNIPAFTGVNISSDIIIDLSALENIIGIKDSSGNLKQLEEIIDQRKENFYVFSGSAQNFYNSLKLGADGGIFAVANIFPEIFISIFKEFRKKNFDEAERLQNLIVPLCEIIQKRFSVSGIKAGMDYVGYSGGRCREPLLELSKDEKMELYEIIDRIKVKF